MASKRPYDPPPKRSAASAAGTYWADHDDEELAASERVVRHQVAVMKQQDEQAAELLDSLSHLRELGTAIGDETDVQTKMIEDLHDDMVSTDARVRKSNKSINQLSADENSGPSFCCLLLLCVILIIVSILAVNVTAEGSSGSGSASA